MFACLCCTDPLLPVKGEMFALSVIERDSLYDQMTDEEYDVSIFVYSVECI